MLYLSVLWRNITITNSQWSVQRLSSWATSNFLAILSDPKSFSKRSKVIDSQVPQPTSKSNWVGEPGRVIDNLEVFDCLKLISDKSMDFDDPKEFDYSQVLDDSKGISLGGMDFIHSIIQRATLIHLSSMVLLICEM